MGKGNSKNAVFGSRSRKVKSNVSTLDKKYYPEDWDKAVKAEVGHIQAKVDDAMWGKLDKAVQEHLTPPDSSFTVTQLAERKGIGRSTAQRQITKLIAKGILGFWPNPRVTGKEAYYFFKDDE